MAHFGHIVLRVLAGIAGAVALYAALFLYEDQQGKIENRLEEWWVKLEDQRNLAVSRNTAFMREVARLAGQGFDRLFGQKLFSLQAFGVSTSLTVAVGCAILTLFDLRPILSLFAAGALCCAMIPAFGHTKTAMLAALVPAVLTVVSLMTLAGFLAVGEVLTVVAISFGCDLVFIATTRLLLRWSSSMRRFPAVIGLTLLTALLAIVMMLIPANVGLRIGLALSLLYVLIFANAVDLIVASISVFLALSMLAHRLFWPLICRPLYALRERGVRRSVFATVGVAMLGYAGIDVPELVRQLIEKGAG